MIEFLRRGRRRSSGLSRSDAREGVWALRLLSGVCVLLALGCLGLAWAYRDKARQVECYAEAADLGLAPTGDCRKAR